MIMKKENIKVVVNYPNTEEGMLLLKERQAAAMVKILRESIPKKELDELFNKLRTLDN